MFPELFNIVYHFQRFYAEQYINYKSNPAQHDTWPVACGIKDPAASNGVSNLQRCREVGYLALAAVARGNKQG